MTYKAIPIDRYYLMVSDKPVGDYAFGNEYDGKELIAVEAKVKDKFPGLPLFDAPWEVDVEKLAYNNYWQKTKRTFAENSRPDMVIGYVDGYRKHAETHPFTRKDMMAFARFYVIESVKSVPFEDQYADAKDVWTTDEFINKFQSLQKPKVYEVILEREVTEWSEGWMPSYSNPDNLGCEPMAEPLESRIKITNNKINILSWKEIN